MEYANIDGSDQPAHPRRLIRTVDARGHILWILYTAKTTKIALIILHRYVHADLSGFYAKQKGLFPTSYHNFLD